MERYLRQLLSKKFQLYNGVIGIFFLREVICVYNQFWKDIQNFKEKIDNLIKGNDYLVKKIEINNF